MKLKTKKTEVWVTISKNGDTAEFLVSPTTPKDDAEMLANCSKTTWQRNQRFTEPDPYMFKIDKIDRVIKDWKGVLDENEEPLACTKKNKELVYAYNSELIDEVLEEANKIGEDEIKQLEVERKN